MKICGPPAADASTFRGSRPSLSQHDATHAANVLARMRAVITGFGIHLLPASQGPLTRLLRTRSAVWCAGHQEKER